MENAKTKRSPILIVITVALCVTVVTCIIIAGFRTLTNTESVMLGVLLSAASILVSWLVTDVYSRSSFDEAISSARQAHSENIRNYAVKAAEKVLNLSNEIQRLVDALEAANEEAEDIENADDSSSLRAQKISSAIHILTTLRSMNDTFLSDWRGVIGEEIDRQQSLEKQIDGLAQELQKQQRERDLLMAKMISPENLNNLQKRIDETEKRLTEKLSDLPFKVPLPAPKQRKEEVIVTCPACGKPNQLTLRRKKGARKLFQCVGCGSHGLATGIEDGELKLTTVPLLSFDTACPVCKAKIHEALPDYPGALKTVDCPSCEFPLVLSRAAGTINVRTVPGKYDVPEKLIEGIIARLPKQGPWPRGIHRSIAAELGISNSLVSRIISKLLDQGVIEVPPGDGVPSSGGDTNGPSSG